MNDSTEPLLLDYFSGGVPGGIFFPGTVADLRASLNRQARGINRVNEVYLIGLTAYFEAFFKDQFAAMINIEASLLKSLTLAGHDVSIDPTSLLAHGEHWRVRLGFLISEKFDFGSAKRINALYSALVKVAPFSKDEARYYDEILRDRNLLVHHGGVVTSSYLAQTAGSSSKHPRGAHFDSLVVTPDYFDERADFILRIAHKTIEATRSAFAGVVANASEKYSTERLKAVDALGWWDAEADKPPILPEGSSRNE
ncbi:MAG: hypothetical protein EPN64_13030 [Burkholderiaceae bacterium]|nr:MAG: hypothetical protein EPN64_13030 [Burkholderiaceae bacterium]